MSTLSEKCSLRREDIFTENAIGTVDSVFAHEVDEQRFNIQLETLSKLHVPYDVLQELRGIRKTWLYHQMMRKIYVIQPIILEFLNEHPISIKKLQNALHDCISRKLPDVSAQGIDDLIAYTTGIMISQKSIRYGPEIEEEDGVVYYSFRSV